ncbi:MAG: hypothetical protein ACT4QF_20790 [Sporichthyaceae bacterium]
MRKMSRAGAVVVAAAAATAVLPAAAATASSTPRGEIVICNHSGYMFDVYADGPSLRSDDLAGSFDECTDWYRVLPGSYQIGFSLRVPSQQNVIIQARFKRDGHVFYKVFNGQGVVSTSVAKDRTTRVDLFIPRA